MSNVKSSPAVPPENPVPEASASVVADSSPAASVSPPDDGVCPLLGEVSGSGKTTEIDSPVECPTCSKTVESHQLTWDPSVPGSRDCAVALSHRGHPEARRALEALDAGDVARAKRIARRHPLREKLLKFLGVGEGDGS